MLSTNHLHKYTLKVNPIDKNLNILKMQFTFQKEFFTEKE